MKNVKFSQAMSGLDERFVREANHDVNEWLNSMEGEVVIADNVKKASPWKIMASVACTAAALFGVFVLAKNVISLGEPEVSASSDGLVEENYFGGEGELKAYDRGYSFYDNNNLYSSFDGLLLQYNKNTNTLSVACDNPSCEHSLLSKSCTAQNHFIFNGDLIRQDRDKLYLCDDKRMYKNELLYKNELPEDFDLHDLHDNQIGNAFALGDDYLVLFNGGYFYILDTDFNIAYTVVGTGTYGGGVYYMGNEIYYIDDQYRLQKLDMESGEPSLVDLGGMNIWEGFVEGDVLWFSNHDELCTYDYKTGEVKVHAEYAFFLRNAGKYIQFSDKAYGREGVYIFDKESGEVSEWLKKGERLSFFDGVYYTYNHDSRTLTLYEEDLTTVIKTCTLEE